MHYSLEVILPPCPAEELKERLDAIMKPFSEHDDDNYSKEFWDYWLIGGRWSGRKLMAKLGNERLDAFNKLLQERKVTVSGVIWGKQTLQPASQQAMVDELWRENFPDSGLEHCPMFDHASDIKNEAISGALDIMPLKDALAIEGYTISRVIVADDENRATYMLQEDFWNGVTHVRSTWDMTLPSAMEMFAKHIAN